MPKTTEETTQVNPEADAAGGQNDAAGGEKTAEGTRSAGGAQAKGGDSAGILDKTDLPPELEETRKNLIRAFHEKTTELSASKKSMEAELEDAKYSAGILEKLMQTDWFQAAYKKYRDGSSGVDDISSEDLERAQSDPKAYRELIQKYVDSIVEKKVGGELARTQEEMQSLRDDKLVSDLSRKYPDFEKLNDTGALDEYVKAGHDLEAAYALAKLNGGGKSDIEKEVEKALAQRKAAATEADGGTHAAGETVIKAKSWDEAFDLGMRAAQEGKKNIKFVTK